MANQTSSLTITQTCFIQRNEYRYLTVYYNLNLFLSRVDRYLSYISLIISSLYAQTTTSFNKPLPEWLLSLVLVNSNINKSLFSITISTTTTDQFPPMPLSLLWLLSVYRESSQTNKPCLDFLFLQHLFPSLHHHHHYHHEFLGRKFSAKGFQGATKEMWKTYIPEVKISEKKFLWVTCV